MNADYLNDPNNWTGQGGSPPIWWNKLDTDDRWYFDNNLADPGNGGSSTECIADAGSTADEDITVTWEVLTPQTGFGTSFTFRINTGGTPLDFSIPGNVVGTGTLIIPSGTQVNRFIMRDDGTDKIYTGVIALRFGDPPATVSYNCDCTDEDEFEPRLTLAELRRRFLIHTGYASQINNPPASAVVLANELLISAQKFLYYKYPALRTRRLFKWSMLEGVRYYGLNENDEDIDCAFRFNPYKSIAWVGVRDLNGAWLQMAEGIRPEYYTMVDQLSIPSYYEIRQCIEVLPAPSADGYELWIKGHFGLREFAVDADVTTIDSEVVLLFAVANRKAAQGTADAKNYASMAQSRLGDLTAGTHGKKRYIPGATPIPPAVLPVFLPVA